LSSWRQDAARNSSGKLYEKRVTMTASPTDDLASAERRIQELTKELSRARGELVEAREQQAATGGILRAISNSPTDLQGIFQEIATSAARLCDAYDAVIRQVDGEVLQLVAHHGPISTIPMLPLGRGTLPGRAALERRTVHVADLQIETEEDPEFRDRAAANVLARKGRGTSSRTGKSLVPLRGVAGR
jgi:two-component system NtrC family sensor kinase